MCYQVNNLPVVCFIENTENESFFSPDSLMKKYLQHRNHSCLKLPFSCCLLKLTIFSTMRKTFASEGSNYFLSVTLQDLHWCNNFSTSMAKLKGSCNENNKNEEQQISVVCCLFKSCSNLSW